jgi:hypothetical protein
MKDTDSPINPTKSTTKDTDPPLIPSKAQQTILTPELIPPKAQRGILILTRVDAENPALGLRIRQWEFNLAINTTWPD